MLEVIALKERRFLGLDSELFRAEFSFRTSKIAKRMSLLKAVAVLLFLVICTNDRVQPERK